jgi:chromosome segregation ATPase
MEDVIFGGTVLRRPQGFAEVTLTLDNTGRELAFDSDEVSVTRRYYRSGESDYLLNRNPCASRMYTSFSWIPASGATAIRSSGRGASRR